MPGSQTVVITGSTGGIGEEIAKILAGSGCNLILVNRSAEKSDEQKRVLAAAYPEISITTVQCDLLDIEHIRKAGATIVAATPRIDALYNIAGVLTTNRVNSAQGHESHYAINVLANYAMIEALRPALRRAAGETPTMVVTMSSSAINSVRKLDVEGLSNPEKIKGLFGAYAQSKAALTVMGAAMANGLEQDNILIRSIDPGATATKMTKGGDGMPGLLSFLAPLLFKKPSVQAAKIVSAADPAACAGRTGILIVGGKEKAAPKLITDIAVQEELMNAVSRDAA